MSKLFTTILVGIIAGLAGAWLYASTVVPIPSSSQAQKETAFDRVMRTGVIRCGYAYAEPLVLKDPNTGQMFGLGYHVMEAMAKALSLKVEWTEEVGWASFPTALSSGRIDAFCTGAWPTAGRARATDHTRPFSYQSYYAYVRTDDPRFDGNISEINKPDVTIAFLDGDASSNIAKSDFPRAKGLALPQLVSVDEVFVNVAMNKADVALLCPEWHVKYNANNPGKIRQVQSQPIRVFGNVIFIAQGEDKLRQMLDTALTEQLSSGAVEKIIPKYEKVPGSILRVAPPYKAQ